MAKKKKRRHRRPVAPPVHSAPDAVHAPPTRAADPFAARPSSPEPPVPSETVHDAPVFEPEPAPARPRKPPQRRRPPRRRRRRRNWTAYVVTGVVVAGVITALVARSASNSKKTLSFDKVAASAGCGKVQVNDNLDRTHEPGVAVKYSTSPPMGGPHDPNPLPGGVYNAAFSLDPNKQPSIYQAVHSMEHGYVIVWYNGLTTDQTDTLTKALQGEPKVIVAPYPQMPGAHKMALTAWGRLDYCSQPSTKAAQAFIDLYRNAKSAPEYYQPAL